MHKRPGALANKWRSEIFFSQQSLPIPGPDCSALDPEASKELISHPWQPAKTLSREHPQERQASAQMFPNDASGSEAPKAERRRTQKQKRMNTMMWSTAVTEFAKGTCGLLRFAVTLHTTHRPLLRNYYVILNCSSIFNSICPSSQPQNLVLLSSCTPRPRQASCLAEPASLPVDGSAYKHGATHV